MNYVCACVCVRPAAVHTEPPLTLWLLHWVVIKTYHIRKWNTNSVSVCFCVSVVSISGSSAVSSLSNRPRFALWCFGTNQICFINSGFFFFSPSLLNVQSGRCHAGELLQAFQFCGDSGEREKSQVIVSHSNHLDVVKWYFLYPVLWIVSCCCMDFCQWYKCLLFSHYVYCCSPKLPLFLKFV